MRSAVVAAVDCELTVQGTTIVCTTVRGVGYGLAWRVAVEGQWSDPSSATLAYTPPSITSVTPLNGPVEGGTTLFLRGTNLGTPANLTIGMGASSSQCMDMSFDANTPDRLGCTLPHSIGLLTGNATLNLTVGDQYTVDPLPVFQYYRALSVEPHHVPMRGGVTLQITGLGFLPSTPAQVYISEPEETGSQSLNTEGLKVEATVLNATTIAFVAPAFPQGPASVRVSQNTQFTLQDVALGVTYYAPPRVDALLLSSGPLEGATPFLVRGRVCETVLEHARNVWLDVCRLEKLQMRMILVLSFSF